MNYELRDAIRQLRTAISGSPWTGKLDKYEVERAANRLIDIAELINRKSEDKR